MAAMKVQGGRMVPQFGGAAVQEAQDTIQQMTAALGDMEAKARVVAVSLDNLRRNNIQNPNTKQVVQSKAIAMSDDYVVMRQAMTKLINKSNELLRGTNSLLR